ncbi:MAG TPA: hypothetical protein VL977_03965 [Solirubrobacteraceae bacterium]|nr:hypothetical protein [Solirubrobacteraceae bacterium]
MARKSLRPHLNQIRTWTRQGRTDAWVAHQLEVTVQQIQSFKRENGLLEDEPGAAFSEEIDLRAEDDALIAAELEAAEQARREAEEAESARREAEDAETKAAAPRRRRTRRGAKGQSGPLEGTFDHGEEGYGLWLDPAITDNPVYAEHWAGHRPVSVTIEEDQIVIKRAE